MIIYQGNKVPLVTFSDRVIKEIYQGQTLVYQKALPSGTVLFEKFGDNGGGFSTYEIILPTSQMVEIVVVGCGSPVVGAVVDL